MIIGAGVDQRLAYHDVAADTLSFPTVNHQGSAILMTREDGTYLTHYTYDAYGEEMTGASGSGFPYLYTGRRFDAQTGLYYYRARYYSPVLGRFLQTDPIGTADQMNLYAYVGNDPLNATDPSGERGQPIKKKAPLKRKLQMAAAGAKDVLGHTLAGMSPYKTYNQPQRVGVYEDDAMSYAMGAAPVAIASIMGGGDEALIAKGVTKVGSELVTSDAAKTIFISAEKYGEAAQHIVDAQKMGHPRVLTIAREGIDANRTASQKGLSKVPGKQLDEYPPAMFSEGGAGASVRPIDPRNNMGAGASIGNQCRGLACGTRVEIRVVD